MDLASLCISVGILKSITTSSSVRIECQSCRLVHRTIVVRNSNAAAYTDLHCVTPISSAIADVGSWPELSSRTFLTGALTRQTHVPEAC